MPGVNGDFRTDSSGGPGRFYLAKWILISDDCLCILQGCEKIDGIPNLFPQVHMTAKACYLEGLQKIAAHELDAAVEAFQKAVEADDTFHIGYLGWAQALDRQGKVDEAIVQVKKAIEIVPDDALAHTSLSRLYQQKDMIPEAEAEMAISQRLSAKG